MEGRIFLISSRDLVRGVLILLVIVDHNEYLRNIGSAFFDPLFVHVTGFFVLSFIATSKNESSLWKFGGERLVRYGIPFIFFYILYSVIFITVSSGSLSYFDYFISDWVPGLLIGSFDAVKRGCGGAFMWFLPALFGFSLLSKIAHLGRKAKYVVIGFSIALYFLPENIIKSSVAQFPIGIGLSLYLLPVIFFAQLLAEYLSKVGREHDGWVYLSTGTVLICSHWILNSTRGVLEIGSMDIPSMEHRFELFVLFCGLISTYLTIDRFTRKDKVYGWDWLAHVGKKSLVIYLVHQLALHGVYKIFKPVIMENYGVFINLILGFCSVVIAVVFSFIFSHLFKRYMPSAKLILPG